MPTIYEAQYEATGVFNIVSNSMSSISEHSTKYVSDNYFKFTGPMKLFAWLMTGMFKKQSLQYLKDFKDFAESEK